MSTSFPTGLDSYTTKVDGVDYPQAAHINNLQDAVAALETKVGINSSGVTTSHDYKWSRFTTVSSILQTAVPFYVAGAAGTYSFRVIDSAGSGDRLRIAPLAAGSGVLIDVTDNAETTATRPLTLGTASANVYIGSSSQFTKDASGNISIGATSSSNKLRVLSSDAAYAVKIENSRGDPTGTGLWVDTRWNVAGNIVARFTTNSGANEILNLYGDQSAVFSGNVGIGITPVTTLHVRGTSVVPAIIQSSGANSFLTYKDAATTNAPGWGSAGDVLVGYTAGVERVRIDATGNVGIGTAPSGAAVHIKTGIVTAIKAETTTARGSGSVVLGFNDPTGSKGYVGYGSPNDNLQVYNGLGGVDIYASGALYGRVDTGGVGGYTVTNAAGLAAVFRAAPTGSNGGALNFYNWNNGNADINLARIYCQTTSGSVGNEAGELFFYTKPAGGALTSRLRIQDSGPVDIQAGSGNLRVGGSITRFESAEIAIPTTTGLTTAAHGGPRKPDMARAVWRCKTAEGGWSVGDEIEVRNDISDTSREYRMYSNGTNVGLLNVSSGPAIRNTSGTVIAITPANWRLVFYCMWL